MAIVMVSCSLLVRRADRYRVLRHGGDVDLDAMSATLPAGWSLHRFAMTLPDGAPIRMAGYVTSHDVDRALVLNAVGHRVLGWYEFPDALLPYIDWIREDREGEMSRRVAESRERNVMGLAGDLSATGVSAGSHIPLVVAPRDAVRVTDDAFDRVVATTGLNGSILFDGCSLSLDDDGTLLPVSQTGNVNELDIHTLVITSDRCIAFMRGTRRHPICPDRLVPTASVSIAPEDLDDDLALQEAMVLALHRKLRSAYGIPDEVPLGSSTLGMSRVIERNGAPEFYAVTRVGCTLGQLLANMRDVTLAPEMDLARPWLGDAQDDDEMSDLLARTAYTVLDSSVAEMGVSLAGLLNALFEAMGDERMRVRIMQRLGMKPRPSTYGGHATGSFSQTGQFSQTEASEVAAEIFASVFK